MLARIHQGVELPRLKPPQKRTRRSPTNDMREKALERKMLFWLNTHEHIVAWKNGEQSWYNNKWILPGMPDIMGFNIAARFVFFVEVKVGSSWRPSQVAFMGVCSQVFIRYVLAYSVEDLRGVVVR